MRLNAQSKSFSKISLGLGEPVTVSVTAARRISAAARLPSSMCAPTAAPLTSARSGKSPTARTLGSRPAAATPGRSSGSNNSSGRFDAAPVVSRIIFSGFTVDAIFCTYLSMSSAHARMASNPSIFPSSHSTKGFAPPRPPECSGVVGGSAARTSTTRASASSGSTGATPTQSNFSWSFRSSRSYVQVRCFRSEFRTFWPRLYVTVPNPLPTVTTTTTPFASRPGPKYISVYAAASV